MRSCVSMLSLVVMKAGLSDAFMPSRTRPASCLLHLGNGGETRSTFPGTIFRRSRLDRSPSRDVDADKGREITFTETFRTRLDASQRPSTECNVFINIISTHV